MKTNVSIPTLDPVNQSSRFVKLGRLLLATVCVSLVSFTAAPRALAAADGNYEFKSATGSLRYDGGSVDIPTSLVKRIATVVDGDIVVRNNSLRVNKNGTVKVIKNFADDLDVDVEASASGPTKLTFTQKTSKLHTGKLSAPIVTSFEGDVFGEDFSGELRTRVAARVQVNTLTLVFNFSGRAFGENFSGRITVTATRVPTT